MSDLLNKKYYIYFEVLTPLHIGAGAEKDWMKGADYISDNGKIYVLNHKKVMNNLRGGADELSNFLLSKNDTGLKDKISGDLKSVSDIVFKSPVSSSNDIKTFIRNGLTNKPIVPGSSLKGAIRSILFSYLKDIYQKDEKQVFGSPDKGDEFMRFIKISDAAFERTELVNTKIFNLYGTAPNLNGGWKHEFRGGTTNTFKPNGFNTIYEVIQPGETGELSIALSDKAFDNFYKSDRPQKKSDILHNELSYELFAIINIHSKTYINKQIGFFEKYSNIETDKIISSLETILNSIPVDNSSCVLQMSAGSGFHSITGDWQFDNFSIDGVRKQGKISRGQLNHNDSAKSRKIATDGNKFELMGFVKLSILTDEVIAERVAKRKEKVETEKRIELERITKKKTEQQRNEAERQAKIDAERTIVEERIAKEKAEKEKIGKLLKDIEEKEKRRQEANKAKNEELKKSGLIILGKINDFTKGKTAIHNYKKINRVIDSSQFEYIKDFIQRCINRDNKKWKSLKRDNWKEVKSWVGQNTAQQWYNELNLK